MATDVMMPQMGESIAEGTIVRWIKRVGDAVERDEPLFEISTDKVDAEIPSPIAGVLTEIRAKEGETVPVNSVVAVIGASATVGATPAPPTAATEVPRAPEKPATPPVPQPQADGSPAPSEPPPAVSPAQLGRAATEKRGGREETPGDAIQQRSSPLVRRIAREHNVDISRIRGTGISGRVTKDDILAFVGAQADRRGGEPDVAGTMEPAPPVQPQGPQATTAGAPAPKPQATKGGPPPGSVVPMSVMRKKIAEHMVLSRRTAAHVHSVFEVDFSRVAMIREAKKAQYERAGAKLTYLSFILKAAVDALRAVPVVNASVDGDNIIYHKDVHVGVAVALEWGLIVPVIRNADEKNLLGLSRAIADLASRARSKQLKPDEVAGGTFTITNPGVFGALFGMPIINQPQVAILGVGHVEKRPVIRDDAIAIRTMAYLSLGYDHRIIDGAVADEFMSYVKREIENWDPSDA